MGKLKEKVLDVHSSPDLCSDIVQLKYKDSTQRPPEWPNSTKWIEGRGDVFQSQGSRTSSVCSLDDIGYGWVRSRRNTPHPYSRFSPQTTSETMTGRNVVLNTSEYRQPKSRLFTLEA